MEPRKPRKMVNPNTTLPDGFDVRKAAQVAAWFAMQEDNKKINRLKLMKLMYLSERKHIELYDFPMLFDNCYIMPHGPALSATVDLSNGSKVDKSWNEFITDEKNFMMGIQANINDESLDELSKADLRILGEIWNLYGHMDQWQLRDETHKPSVCPEWTDPDGSSIPISYKQILEYLNKEKSEEITEEIESFRSVMGRLRAAQ